MFGKTFVAASVMIMAVAGTASAQTPTRINQFDAWGAYSYKSGNNTVCYVLSAPVTAEPKSVNHGDNYFLVTKRTGNPVSYEPQFMAGYALKDKVIVSVDGKNFEFFTKDSSAWAASPATESQLVAAMKNGSNLSIKAVSQRGTNTSYTYSLKGITAALNAAQKCK
ncbi:invasion associated locus B family protein [uncultured Bartonella sp.]|uniref:invasion associated locus B family protein n=1 Tax=uncultured Bartonella sp. TaxID=104108 RepID=UPI0025E1E8C1|nr:invasion associated locus B family protein [uncultured Bartonella sp.]